MTVPKKSATKPKAKSAAAKSAAPKPTSHSSKRDRSSLTRREAEARKEIPNQGKGHPITDEQKAKFLENLSKTAHVTKSAAAAMVSRDNLYRLRQRDPEFAKLWDEAYRIGYLVLEEEAQRRAFQGVDEPVFYKGDVCGYVRKFSDQLAMFLLRGNLNSKFRDRVDVTVDGELRGGKDLTDEELDAYIEKREKLLKLNREKFSLGFAVRQVTGNGNGGEDGSGPR